MKRLTIKEDGQYLSSDGKMEEVLIKLGKFEDFVESILEEQLVLAKKLESLRKEGKVKSVKFRELLGQKLVNNRILTLLEIREVEY